MFILSGRYFDEISQDTGKYCFGVDDSLKGLEMGAVDTLIVWENLDITRYVLKNHSTDGMLLIIYWEYFLSSDFDDHHDLLDIVWDYEMFRVPGMLNLIFISLYQQLLVVCGKYDSSQMMLFKQGYF